MSLKLTGHMQVPLKQSGPRLQLTKQGTLVVSLPAPIVLKVLSPNRESTMSSGLTFVQETFHD